MEATHSPRCPECTQPMRRVWQQPNYRGCLKWTCSNQCENVVVYTRGGEPVDSIDALAGQGPRVTYIK